MVFLLRVYEVGPLRGGGSINTIRIGYFQAKLILQTFNVFGFENYEKTT